MSQEVGDHITSESTNAVEHAELEPLHHGSNIVFFSVVISKTFSIIYTQLQTYQFAKMINLFNVRNMDRIRFEINHPNVLYI